MLPGFCIVSCEEGLIIWFSCFFYLLEYNLTSLKVIYFLLSCAISSYIFMFYLCDCWWDITLHRFWMQLMTNPGVLMVQHWLRLHRPLKNCTDSFVTLHTWILLETLRPLWFFTLFPFCCTSCYYLDLICITWLMYWNMIQLRVSDGYECFMEKIYWTWKELALCLQGNTKFVVGPLQFHH